MDITRRDLLKLAAMAAAAGAAGGVAGKLGGSEALAETTKTPDIAAITGSDPAANAKAAIEALGGMKRFVKKGDKVVVKPNIGFGNPVSHCATTDPAVVRAVAELALQAGAKRVMVIDNPCHKPEIALEISGIKKAVAGLSDCFAYTVRRSSLFRETAIPKGVALKKQNVAKDLLDADCIIAAPLAKSHGSAKVTFCMKGWMGMVEDRGYWHSSVDLNQAIADIATIIKPKLIVLDATRALITGGPGGPGDVVKLNTVAAGTDQVAMDAFGLTLAKFGGGEGYKLEDVPYIKMAADLGVGNYDLTKLTILRQTL